MAISDIMNRHLVSVEVSRMIHELKEKGIWVDGAQLHWIAQEDPHHDFFIPAGSNEEVMRCPISGGQYNISSREFVA